MNWMFWKKDGQTEKLPGPKEISQTVASYLVTEAHMSPDLVWHLKAVTIPRSDEKEVIDIRVYESGMLGRKGVEVINYHSLDDHLGLVILDGWYNKANGTVGKRNM